MNTIIYIWSCLISPGKEIFVERLHIENVWWARFQVDSLDHLWRCPHGDGSGSVALLYLHHSHLLVPTSSFSIFKFKRKSWSINVAEGSYGESRASTLYSTSCSAKIWHINFFLTFLFRSSMEKSCKCVKVGPSIVKYLVHSVFYQICHSLPLSHCRSYCWRIILWVLEPGAKTDTSAKLLTLASFLSSV